MSRDCPRVSIVTPTHHMVEFLGDAIRSVAAQDHPSVEQIIVDGGCDAETPASVRRHPDIVYIREPDRGQSDAINKGFRRATGDILAWLNADDYYFPDAVSRAVRCFAEHPDVDLLYGDAVYVDRAGQFLRYFTEVEAHDPERLLNHADYICQPTTFFRRSAVEQVGFLDEGLDYAMDWDLWCRLVRAGCGFHYERAPIAVNREYSGTKTQGGGAARIREILRVNQRHKTGLMPWAALSFARDSVESNHALAPGVSLALWPMRALKRALVGRRFVPSLYGLHHHSRAATRQVRLSVPVMGDTSRAEVAVGLPRGLESQEVHVSANGKVGVVRLDRIRPAGTLQLPIVDNRVDVELEAELPHEVDGREVCFLLHGFRLLG